MSSSLPYHFLFFIGNSGAGKDTCMELFQRKLSLVDLDVENLRRFITRPKHMSEDFISVNEPTFKEMVDQDKFAFYWKVYGIYYGYHKDDIRRCKEKEIIALFNISRSVIPVIRHKYPSSVFIEVKAPKEVSKQRVEKRKRSDQKSIDQRVKRMHKDFDLPEDRIIIDNSSTLKNLSNRIGRIINELFVYPISMS